MAEFKLPEVGEGIDSGIVVGILVAVGDMIEKDQPVIELETDKAVVEVPSGVSGVVQSINVKANEEAKVGQTILTVGEGEAAEVTDEAADEAAPDEGGAEQATEDEALEPDASEDEAQKEQAAAQAEQKDPAAKKSPEAESSASKTPDSKPSVSETASSQASGSAAADVDRKEQYTPVPKPSPNEPSDEPHIPAAPSVRRLAREMGVDLREVAGSGVLGRISAQDVRQYAENGAPSPQAPATPASAPTPAPAQKIEAPPLPDFGKWGETERAPMSGIRKATVRAMTQAWSSVPMVTQFDRADITEFEVLRKRYGPKAEAVGAKLTPTAMLIKVLAGALRKFPDFNASIDTSSNEIVYKHYVNIGVAVDTPNGLLVPVIKHADRKNMVDLAQELGELAEKARDRKLAPDDMQGGNFNISNLGGIGGTNFTPIVNPPDVAILGVSRSTMEPVWDKETSAFVPRMMMPLALTYDHRLIDGAQAARFLRWVCTAIEDPFLLALEG